MQKRKNLSEQYVQVWNAVEIFTQALSVLANIACKGVESKGVRTTCTLEKQGHIFCNGSVPVGTVARMECENYYSAVNSKFGNNVNVFQCQPDGNWNGQVLKCKPGRPLNF